MISKTLASGPLGSLVVSEADAEFKAVASFSATLGGAAAGAAKAVVSAEIDVEGKELIDLGFSVAAAKYPSAAPFIQAAQAEIDAILAKN